jgi:hypothetical protein
MSSVLIGYPTGWTLAVVDDEPAASRAAEALRTLGFGPDEVLAIAGPGAPDQLRRLGASSGLLARGRRAIQFMAMDQLPDLFVYEAALEQGRGLVAVRARPDRRASAVEVLRSQGAHFINSFGAWMTSEIEPWRGPMPPIPQHMQR